MGNLFQKNIFISNPEDFNIRLDVLLSKYLDEHVSRTEIQKSISNGNISINGKICLKCSFKIEEASEIIVKIEKNQVDYELIPSDIHVPILYEDSDIAVAYKPVGMTIHPGAGTQNDTLVHSLIKQLNSLSSYGDESRPGIIHRLDKDTEGVVVVAKNNKAHRLIAEQFMAREIYKEYHAWFDGIPSQTKGSIIGSIRRSKVDRKLMEFIWDTDVEGAKYSELEYEVVKVIEPYSLIKIILKTGRTHQIRVSFKAMKLSVLNDNLYANRKQRKLPAAIQKLGLLLMANRLVLIHPITQEKLDFSVPLSERFTLIEKFMLKL